MKAKAKHDSPNRPAIYGGEMLKGDRFEGAGGVNDA